MSVVNTNSNIPTSGEVRPAAPTTATPQKKSLGDHASALGNQASKAASSTWSGITGMFKSKPATAPAAPTSAVPTTTVGGRRKHKRSGHKKSHKKSHKKRTRKHRGGAECNLLQTKLANGKCRTCKMWSVPHRTNPGECVLDKKDYVKLFKAQKKADKQAAKMVAQTAPAAAAPVAPVAPVVAPAVAPAMKGGYPKKGKRSKTRKGRKDFVTHKGNKYYNRKSKRQTKSRKGRRGKPYSRRNRK